MFFVSLCTTYVYQPVDKVFTKITLFHNLCTITKNNKTNKQLVQLAYLIFNRKRAFVDTLKKWNDKLTEDKTYTNFKQHMRDKHHAFKRVGALTIQDSTLYQANLMQNADMQAQIDEQVKTILLTAITDFQVQQTESEPEEVPVENMEANNLKAQDTNAALLELLQKLTKKVNQLTCQPAAPNPSINPKTGKPFKRYCWYCGCCDHWGRNCTNKKPGH